MHFWNKLSTAALMRLTILASLNLLLGRLLAGWAFALHPLFFLTIVTLDLGLYSLMVYSGALNKTLIAMMLAGLAGVLAVVAWPVPTCRRSLTADSRSSQMGSRDSSTG